jgi:LysR family nitrogen assimilation transcriptional regulator
MLNLRALHNFIKIVELGGVSRAADHLHIAQPALSNQLAALEADLGAKLFNRSSQGVQPTEAGMILYRHAQALLAHVEETCQQVKASASALSGAVSIGMPGSILEFLVVPLLKRLRQEHPDIRPNISANQSTYLGELVINGRIDVALTYENLNGKGLSSKLLAAEELYFVVLRNNEEDPNQTTPVSLKEVAGYPLLLPARPYIGRILMEEAAARAGVKLNVIGEINTAGALREAAAAGLGATMLAWSGIAQYPNHERFVIRPVTPSIKRRIWLYVSDVLPLSAAAKATVQLMPSLFAELAMANAWRGFTPSRQERS